MGNEKLGNDFDMLRNITKTLTILLALQLMLSCVADKKLIKSEETTLVTGISPSGGSDSGGTVVTVVGSGFESGAVVTIGGSVCSGVSVSSTSSLTCTTTAHAIGTVDVSVINTNETMSTLGSAYTYLTSPLITSVSSTFGSLAGAQAVTITGDNFVTGTTIDFDGSGCLSLTVVSSTSLTCVTSAHASGLVEINATNPDGQTGSLANAYTYIGPPTFTSITPNGGVTGGVTSVSIVGTNFMASVTVELSAGNFCTITAMSSTLISCDTPALGGGAVDVIITNLDGQTVTAVSAYTYQNAPAITAGTGVSSTSGPAAGGDVITITGTDFISGATVDFAGTSAATVVWVNATQLTVTTPVHAAGTANVTVTNPDLQSDTYATAYTFVPPPTMTSLSKIYGPQAGAQTITINGTDFITGVVATFGGNPCVATNFTNSTTLVCNTTPAHAPGAVSVVVTNPDGQSSTLVGAYTYRVPPTITNVEVTAITGVSTGALAGGTNITITGTGFLAGATITLDAVACTNLIVVGATEITCDTPTHIAGAVDVVLANDDDQNATSVGAYTYINAPAITVALSPVAGPLAGANVVTITGTDFVTGATVTFDGVAGAAPTVVIATTITVQPAAHIAGTVNVIVTNPDGQSSASLGNTYTYMAAPIITLVAPDGGTAAGGTQIVLTGTSLLTGATVTVGANACVEDAVTATTFTCTIAVAAHALGAANIVFTNVADGQTYTATGGYTYQDAPSITSLDVTVGSVSGGTTVTITGTDFLAGATVTFDGTDATIIGVISTQIQLVTPPGAAGAVDVVVTNNDNQLDTDVGGYTYSQPPTITDVNPASSIVAGGTTITLTGTNYVNAPTVTVGGAPCTGVVFGSATSVTCATPVGLGAGVYDIVVTNPDTLSATSFNAIIYQGQPVFISVLPTAGALAGGTTIVIVGTDFVDDTLLAVTVDGGVCTNVTFVSSTQITCDTPAHAASAAIDIVVTNGDGQTTGAAGAAAYTYQVAPAVTVDLSPDGGLPAGGTSITITGTGFLAGASVDFGGSACAGTLTVVNVTTITCDSMPAGAGSITVTVTNTDAQFGSRATAYTYQAAPAITSISPVGGVTGGATALTINGTDFRAGATVTVGGVVCAAPTVTPPALITCTTGAAAAGASDVVVTNTDAQTATSAGAYNYLDDPTVTLVTATAGTTAGGTTVMITGTNFAIGATATFDGTACTSPTVVPATFMTCVTPAHAAGAVNVAVTNLSGQSGTGVALFTYQAAPTVTSLSISAGALAGGTTVTITGTGFITGAVATFGGVACAVTNFTNITTLVCNTTGAHAAGVVDIVVTNPDAQAGTLASAYTYQAAPVVSYLTQNIGPLAGTSAVIITGTGFLTGATVTFDGGACTSILVETSVKITCITPAHAAGVVDVVVTNSDTQTSTLSNGYTYVAAPTITAGAGGVTPGFSSVAGGVSLTIAGTGMLPGATVVIGIKSCTGVVVAGDGNSLTCTSPSNSIGAYDVILTNPDSQTVTWDTQYSYVSAPIVTSISPDGGPLAGATAVTITGSGFLTGAIADFGGSACAVALVVVSSTSITCASMPGPGAGAIDITVTNLDAQFGTLAGGYTYKAAPTATIIAPAIGNTLGGHNVTITGTGFITGATVSVGGVDCTSVSVVTDLIVCTLGARAAAAALDVIVTNPDTQTGTLVGAFEYKVAPTITTVSPTTGTINGGTLITISGTDFDVAGTTVTVGGNTCTSNSTTAVTITCLTPSHAAGIEDVVVTNDADALSTTDSNAFTFASMAELEWQVGVASPNPANPDNYGGAVSTNISHTYTLKNVGNIITTTITVSASGDTGAWFMSADTCSGVGNELPSMTECTVTMVFLGATNPAGTVFNADLNATATTGGTAVNAMTATTP